MNIFYNIPLPYSGYCTPWQLVKLPARNIPLIPMRTMPANPAATARQPCAKTAQSRGIPARHHRQPPATTLPYPPKSRADPARKTRHPRPNPAATTRNPPTNPARQRPEPRAKKVGAQSLPPPFDYSHSFHFDPSFAMTRFSFPIPPWRCNFPPLNSLHSNALFLSLRGARRPAQL
jgi:hypothetical protein